MENSKRIIIVGGVAGGASAAARARRISENSEIIMFERGEYISFANCGMPYHIGEVITDRKKLLVQTPESLYKRFRIDVRTKTEVVKIDRQKQEVITRNLETGEEITEKYDSLILSPGADPFRPPIKGIDSTRVFTLRNIPDMDAIKALVDKGGVKKVAVIGGGAIGLEMAEALRTRHIEVVIIELLNQVMAPMDPEMATPLHNQLKLHKVDLRLGTSVSEFSDTETGISLKLSTGGSLECDFAILSIGVRPSVALAREAGLAIGERGGIVVDEYMRTNDPNIFAVGDAVETIDFVGGFKAVVPLAGPANRQGRLAADNVFGRNKKYKNTQGTAICKAFDLTAALTGMSEKSLKREKIKYEKIYIHPSNHAGYYPGSAPISIKMLFDPDSGKILGAQAVGSEGVDKRIDVFATAIRAGLTVFDLEDLELCYAPPYGSAKDPLNYAGFVAANMMKKDVEICHVEDVLNPNEDQVVLDVRTPAEIQAGGIPGAINIPVDDLRDRLNELSKDKEYLVSCRVGLRGYVATRILTQKGYRARNLTGGYITYSMVVGNSNPEKPITKETIDNSAVKSVEPPKRKIDITIKHEIDATGLQCPGPIMQLKNIIAQIQVGEAVAIEASDPGFISDAPAWCNSTGNELHEISASKGKIRAIVIKHAAAAPSACPATVCKKMTAVVFSNDLDKAIAAFIIANGAATMGNEVTLFFTFWGLNILRKDRAVPVKKTFIESMFGWMMPRGARKLKLSKMHMAGMGTGMIKSIMKKKNVASLPELIESAKGAGVKLVACTMTMGLMGFKREEMIDGVEEGGVAMYLNKAESGNINLFI